MVEIPRVESDTSVLFFVFLAGFALIVLMEYMYPVLFRRDTRHLFYFSGLDSEQRTTKTYITYQIMSQVVFAFTVSLVFTVILGRMYFHQDFSLSLMTAVFAVLSAYMFLRYILDRILAWLFDMGAFADDMTEKVIAMRLAVGVYGLAAFFIFMYSGFSAVSLGDHALIWAFTFYIVMYFAVTVEYLVSRAGYFFYFIFYLCIVEICPLLIAWNLLEQALT